MITLQLGYLSGETHIPAFGHAPGDITTFTEDILTGYFEPPHCVDSCITFAPATAAPTTAPTTKASAASAAADPTMIGKVPGLSSIIALDEQLTEQDIICRITLSPPPPYSQATNKEIELTFQLFAGNSCPAIGTGTPLRDKTARFSLSYADSAGNIFFPPIVDQEEGNKFHWENKKGLNEFDFGTKGLPTTPQAVTYTITIFSSKASPNGTTFILNP